VYIQGDPKKVIAFCFFANISAKEVFNKILQA